MHSADSYNVAHPTQPTTATSAHTATALLRIEFSAKQTTHAQPKLIDLMRERIERKEFFYGIELTPRSSSKKAVTVNYQQFDALMPLFTSIVWLGAEYAHLESVHDIQAVQFAQALHERTPVLPHFSAYRLTSERLRQYLNLNFSNILIVRGDQVDDAQDFKYAYELVKEVRRLRGDSISIGVAGYPEGHPDSKTIDDDLHYLQQKVAVGADFIITQICYSSTAIIEFIRSCRKTNITVPIIVGIFAPEHMRPIEFLARIANIRMAEEDYNNLKILIEKPQAFAEYTAKLAKRIIQDVLASDLGVYGFQFFTLNKFHNVENIIKELQGEREGLQENIL